MIVRKLVTLLGFETDKSSVNKANSAVDGLGKKMRQLAVVLAPAAVAGFFGAIVKGAADSADAAAKSARSLAITTEAYQELSFAADQAGLSQEQFSAGLRTLSRNAFNAENGSKELAKAFSRAGVALRGADGTLKTSDELLSNLADTYVNAANKAEVIPLFSKLLGEENGARFVSLLANGSKGIDDLRRKAKQLGIVFDHETAVAAEQFNDSMSNLRNTMSGLGFSFSKQLLPSLLKFTDALGGFILGDGAGAVDVAESIGRAFAKMIDFATISIEFIGEHKEGFKALGKFLVFFAGPSIIGKVIKKALMLFGVFGSGAGILATLVKPFRLILGLLGAVLSHFGLSVGFLGVIGRAILALAGGPVSVLVGIITAVYLIVEDLYTFFTGGNSITGKIVDGFKSAAAALDEFYVVFMAFFLNAEKVVYDWLASFGNWATSLAGSIMQTVASIVDAVMGPINAAIDGVASKIDFVKNAGGAAFDFAEGVFDDVGNAIFGGDEMGAALAGGGALNPRVDQIARIASQNNSRNNSVATGDINVTISGAPNMTPQQFESATKNAISDALSDELRRSSRDFSGGLD